MSSARRFILARPGRAPEEGLLLELARLDFVRRKEDLVVTGKSGTGKSHILLIPEKIKQLSREGNQVWSLAKFEKRVSNARSFFINTTHPLDDERLSPQEDETGALVPPAGTSSWDAPGLHRPMAVAKFKARADLCLKGYDRQALLKPETCSSCEFVTCRANTNYHPPEGELRRGAKTYWSSARVGLLAHSSFKMQAAFAPERNKSDLRIFDEIPSGLVYRCPKLKLYPRDPAAERSTWGAEISTDGQRWWPLLDVLEGKDLPEVERVRVQLEKTIVTLGHRAQQVRAKAMAGKSPSHSRMVDDGFTPILNKGDFAALVGAKAPEALLVEEDEEDSDGREDQSSYRLYALRDFSADSPFPVFMEHTFEKSGVGSLTISRPVNGWSDVLEGAKPTIILDATAGVDPRYDLLQKPKGEVFPEDSFPNTKVVSYAAKTVSKTKLKDRGDELLAQLPARVVPYLQQLSPDWLSTTKLLVLGPKSLTDGHREQIARFVSAKKLPVVTRVAHFGSLRGRNSFRDFDAVYFLNAHRYAEDDYVGLDLLLRGFQGYPKKWVSKNDAAWKDASNTVRCRMMACDIFQDAMRIGLRSNRKRHCFVFVPVADAQLNLRLMRFFRDAQFQFPGDSPEVRQAVLATIPARPKPTLSSPADAHEWPFGPEYPPPPGEGWVVPPVPRPPITPPPPLSDEDWMAIVDCSGLDHDAKVQLASLALDAPERLAVLSEWATTGSSEANDIVLALLGDGLAKRWLLEHTRRAEQPKQFDPRTMDPLAVMQDLKRWFRDQEAYGDGGMHRITPEIVRQVIAEVSQGNLMTKEDLEKVRQRLFLICVDKMEEVCLAVRKKTRQVAHDNERSIEVDGFWVTIAEILEAFSSEARGLHPGYYFGAPDYSDDELFEAVKKASADLPDCSKTIVLGKAAQDLVRRFLTTKGFYDESTPAKGAV